MREQTHHATVAVPSVVRYVAVSAVVLLGFLMLLVVAAHPVPGGAAVGGAVVSATVGRARKRVASYADRSRDSDELAESGPV